MAELNQENTLLAIDTPPPLGKDALLLAGIHGQEYISQPFSFDLELVSKNKDISFGDIIGKEVTVTIRSRDPLGKKKDIRYIHGIIARFSQSTKPATKAADNSLFYHYEATLVPWLWLLSQTTNLRIFQNKKVPDIITQIFDEKGYKDYHLWIQGSFAPREYCVQYSETDLNFISRLLEEEGIGYYFKHEEKKHTLVLTNKFDKPCPKQETAQFIVDETEKPKTDLIFSVERTGQIVPGKFSLRDFNYELPQKHREADTTGKTHGPGKSELYEVFEYPGRFSDNDAGKVFAKIKMDSHAARTMILEGTGDCRAFTGGYTFELKKAQLKKLDGKYLLTLVEHLADSDLFLDKKGSYYVNYFQCIPVSETPYRPLQITPKPVMRGPQTAIVVGPGGNKGEEISMDKLGRVKVQFHWDREGQNNDKSSCWIRVAQTWAGNQWGAQFIPRTGHEVIVDFLDGDPDRPLITGSVYHEQNKLPYEGDPTKTGIKSKSYQGDKSVTGFNELRFEDKKDKEEIYIHAQKDMKTEVEEGDKTLLIKKGDHFETVEKGKIQIEVKEGTIEIKTGKDIITIDSGKNIVYKAKDQITLECGKAKITMTKDGKIKVEDVNWEGIGKSEYKFKCNGQTIIQSAMVKIN